MNELDAVFDAVASYFAAMSEPTRVKIVHAICQQERSVTQIVEEVGASQSNVSRHLGILFHSGLVARRRHGNQVFYRVADAAMLEICRAVCTQIAGRIDQGQPLRRGLLKLIPGRRREAA